MVGSASKLPRESMTAQQSVVEDEAVLRRYGLNDAVEEKSSFLGRGGFSTVMIGGLFASIGGMLFGLDIGYIAGVKYMDSFRHDILGGKALTDDEDSKITMVFGVGAAISAFPPVIDALVSCMGRKGSVVGGGLVFCAGALLQGLASNLPTMMTGRFVAGASVGILSANVPVYQSEIAPPSHRGMLVSIYQLAITVGIMCAFVLAVQLEHVDKPVGGWRWVILAQLVPGALLVAGGLAMGESPSWLVSQGRSQDALAMLVKIRGADDDIKGELAAACREHERDLVTGQPSWKEFLSGDMLKLLLIGLGLQLLQQMCGMNVYMYDGPKIFKKLFNSGDASRLFTAVAGFVNILSTLPAIFLIDRVGRCTLLKCSAAGMVICCITLALVGSQCFPQHHARTCDSSVPTCGAEAEVACGEWSKWVATGSICLFIFNFGYGWGPVVWTYCAEMFPTKYRTRAVGATTDANWVGNIFIAMLPPLLLDWIGFHTFWLFAAINVVGYCFGAALPETKDKTLEEIQATFEACLKGEDSDDEDSSYDASDDS